jgi:hypothetical protein
MTIHKLSAVGALVVALGGSAAFAAHSAGAYVCQTWNPTKVSRAVSHCVTWTREAATRMRAAGCDPAMMGDAAMSVQCAAMMVDHQGQGLKPTQAG